MVCLRDIRVDTLHTGDIDDDDDDDNNNNNFNNKIMPAHWTTAPSKIKANFSSEWVIIYRKMQHHTV
jgi:hypothetical protein